MNPIGKTPDELKAWHHQRQEWEFFAEDYDPGKLHRITFRVKGKGTARTFYFDENKRCIRDIEWHLGSQWV